MQRNATVLAFLGLLAAVSLGDLISAKTVPLYGDLVFFVLPMKQFLATRLHLGEIPLWNPWIYMGTPFLAGLQTGVFYPPSVLLALPFPLGLNLFLLAHYFIALVGAFAFLRDRSLSRAACGVGSLTFVLGGYLVSMMSETNHLQAGAWAPWVLLSWARYGRARRSRDLAMAVLTIALQLLAGAPETLLMTLGVAAAWTAWQSFRAPADGVRLSLALGGVLGLAVLICSFQILPTAEYIAESDRGERLSFEEVSAWSLEPISLLQLVLPRTPPPAGSAGSAFPLGFEAYAPWIQSLYFGVIPLCLAFAGLLGGRERVFWGLLIAVSLLLALGSRSPLLALLYKLAPAIVGRFRYPQKAYFLVHLGVSVLAAEGCAALGRTSGRARWTACFTAVSLLALAAFVLSASRFDPTRLSGLVAGLRGNGEAAATAALTTQVVQLSWRLASIAGIFLALLLFRRFRVVAPTTFDTLLVLAVATDLGTIHRGLRATASWSSLTALPPVVEPARLSADRERVFHYQTTSASFPGVRPEPVRGLQELDRVSAPSDDPEALWFETWRILFADIGMVYGVGSVSGGDGIGRRSNAILLQTLSSIPRDHAVRLLGLYSVGWMIGTAPLEVAGLEAVSPAPPSRYYVYRLTKPLPEARLVANLDVAPSDGEALRRLLSPDFPVETSAVVAKLPPGWSNPRETEQRRPPGHIRIVSYRCDEVMIDVATEERAFLVLNDSYFPGWEARIDGTPAEIFQTNAFVRGTPVEGGHHRVEFRYRPASLIRGAFLSALGLLGFSGLAIAGIHRERRCYGGTSVDEASSARS